MSGDKIVGGMGVIENDFLIGKTLLSMSAQSIQKKTTVAKESHQLSR